MGQLSQYFQPPLYWQQFEDLTQAVFAEVFGDPSPSKNGRQGQAQHGVDVYGTYVRVNWQVGIQCKQMDERDENNQPVPGGVVTRQILKDEYGKASGFNPSLQLWILATTARRDAGIQEAARDLDEKSKKKGAFSVKLWFWDDFITFLNSYDSLQRLYYSTVLNFSTPADQDLLFLELYAMAFSRPAFQVPFRHEGPPVEFIDAMKDTKRALNTGELLDRETRHVIRKVLGGRRYIQNDEWRKKCDYIYSTLHTLYLDFVAGESDGRIKYMGGSLQLDPALEKHLNDLRSRCLKDLNRLLKIAGLKPV